jgi:glycosyltransferase involved in cell wall biosynthesis
MPKLIRITTVPMALHVLLKGQMKFMKEKGFEVVMVSADGREREAVLADEGCPHIIIPMTRQITPFKDLQALYRLTKLFRKHKPDIIHSHTPKAGLLAMMAGKLAGVKIRIHTVAGLRFMTAHGLTRKLLVQMEKMTGRFATHVWPNSFSLAAYIRENKLIPGKKLDVIGKGSSNGINLKRYSKEALQSEKLSAIKKKISYDDNLVYLLCVGRIVKDKGIDELVKAFEKAYASNQKLRLLLVGDFEDELDPVSDQARELLKTHPGIIMPGWSEDVEYYMEFSFALLHPSYREGFQNVVLLGGALFCRVIFSRILVIFYFVDHG